MNNQFRFFIKKPSKKRKSFALVCYTSPAGYRKYESLPLDLKTSVDKINEQFQSQIINVCDAETLIKDLIQKQYKKLGIRDMVLKNSTLSSINQKVFNTFWSKVYEHKPLVDRRSARYDFLKAIRLIEPLSLVTAGAAELAGRLREMASIAEQRRAIDRLNQVLKYLNRDFRLSKPEEGIRTIRYINEVELEKLLPHFEDSVMKDLIMTLFATGLRLSESLALRPEDIRPDGSLNVDKQFTEHKVLKRPKRGKVGRVYVLPFGLEALRRWSEVQDKPQYRERLQLELRRGAKRWLGREISPHDLRHSHAIYLLGQGASLTQVALNLRNRIEVCQKYYTGFSHSDETIQALNRVFKK